MNSELVSAVGGMFALGAFLMFLIHRTQNPGPDRIRTDWLKYGVFLVIISGLLMAAWAGRVLITIILALLIVAGCQEFRRGLRESVCRTALYSLVFAVFLSLCLGHLLLGNSTVWSASFAFVLLVVASTDAFSELWGRLVGRRKLCSQLSPGKTWGGFVGGIATSVVYAVILSFLLPCSSIWLAALIGLVVAASAVAGDLAFSYIKRRLNIKDFSNTLPGHGGLLDRFDSLVIAAPVHYWTISTLVN